MMPTGFIRSSRHRHCPICGKPDWCLIGTDGERVICARNESQKRMGDAGWLHKLSQPLPPVRHVRPEREGETLDCRPLLQRWMIETTTDKLADFADDLGVSRESLRLLGCVWAKEHDAWAFPMSDATGKPIGIRLRNMKGEKWAVRGSRAGLFIPREASVGALFVCEGPTDCAALLGLGISVIGRPSCTGGTDFIRDFIRDRKPAEVVIFADHDGPGLKGAELLAASIWKPTRIVAPPKHKDARAWIAAGATRAVVLAVVGAQPYVTKQIPEAANRRLTASGQTG